MVSSALVESEVFVSPMECGKSLGGGFTYFYFHPYLRK